MNNKTLTIQETPFQEFEYSFLMTQQDITFGEAIDPLKRLAIFSADEFESFIQLWATEYLKSNYQKIVKCGGAGDKGRDIIAYASTDNNTWDNYQCKHYDHPLRPSDIWVEIGKLCYYTYHNSYTVPQNYYFVCHKGIGQSLLSYLENVGKLKADFLTNWDTYCKNKITKNENIELTDNFKSHINKLDFSIFKHLEPLELILPIKGSIGYSSIFGGGLKKRREVPLTPPSEINKNELVYTKKIFEAYSDYLGENIQTESDIENEIVLKNHFQRQRKYFYTAESLLLLERDFRVPKDTTVNSIKEEIFDSIIDTVDSDFPNGFERLKKVTEKARKCDLNAHPLLHVTNENDKHGLCHHLANENRIGWVKKDEEK